MTGKMQRLGIDLGALRSYPELETPFVQPTCPGARVYVTRELLETMVHGGEVFDKTETYVPGSGYGHARVRCGRPVERWMGFAGHVVYAGLCGSCHGLEQDNRALLRAAKGAG